MKDRKHHEDNDCEYKEITCSVVGCDHKCLRKDMASHMCQAIHMHMHMQLMTKSIEEKCEKKIKSIEANCEKKIKEMQKGKTDSHSGYGIGGLFEPATEANMQISHMRHTNDCRYWIENRPDALFDVKIHRIMRRAPSGGNVITGLMCYIPGKSAFVLFDHANSSVQYKVSVIRLL